MAGITPMMQQYLELKEQYKDCILFFRLGDFYEMFFEDAILASKELEITLTGRDCGLDERAPMCGVPYHAANNYINKLISKGYKVAICEQMEDPSLAKGIVKRDILRIVTPGTQVDNNALDEIKNNYICSVVEYEGALALSICDVSTGELHAAKLDSETALIDEFYKFNPSEILISVDFNDKFVKYISNRFDIYVNYLDSSLFEYNRCSDNVKSHFEENQLKKLSTDMPLVIAVGVMIEYLKTTQKINLEHINNINIYNVNNYMLIDSNTKRNLELLETMRDKSKKGSLLGILDKTVTSMGGRLIRKWIEQPLIDVKVINNRLDSVGELKDGILIRQELREQLKKVYDIERLSSRIVYGSVNGRDLIALKNTVGVLPSIKEMLNSTKTNILSNFGANLDLLDDIFIIIEDSIIEEPPITVKEGNIIKKGYNEDVDRLRSVTKDSKEWIAQIENEEKEKTGIKNLKIGYNKVFGYYVEITKSNTSQVPDYYIRKQTISNGERYIIPKLKEIEETLLTAETKLMELEFVLFNQVRTQILEQIKRLQEVSIIISNVDVLTSIAEVSYNNNYNKPEVVDNNQIQIVDGRHPVVEKMIDNGLFVPNDTLLDTDENRLLIITGPNMAGKSTYMRQVALIVLMAHIGCFVPAKEAVIGIVDRIFTRVGASDDLASGQSTFMVEMTEVSNILHNATNKSLIILDEIGRGTSTFDGLSIAWAVVEYISDSNIIGAKTLFATHYHELTELEENLSGVKNYCISVKERGDDIIFLRKIIRGGADGSYGIQVAKLAGLPDRVIEKSKEILNKLEEADINKPNEGRNKKMPIEGQIDLFSVGNQSNEIVELLKDMEVTTMSPIEALNKLYEISQKAKGM